MANILHKIRVYLYENYLTDNPNDLSAKVISERTLNVKEICKSAISRGGAPSSSEAMEHNVMLFLKEMSYQLMDGYAINTGYFTANTQVRGVFDNSKENFNPQKHSILFRFNQGELLRKEIPNIDVQVMGMGESNIVISHVVDKKTGSVNDIITSGGVLKIRGGKLKIVGDKADIGVFFERGDGDIARVEDNDIIVNNPSELIVEIPELKRGLRYKLIIRNQYSASNTFLKEVREAVFEKTLIAN